MGSLAAGDAAPTYIITPDDTNVIEGSLFGVVFSGTNIPDGTYYWTIETNGGDFVTSSGSVNVISNIGSFEITPTADATTEGAETFTVSWRSGSVSGTVLQTSSSVTIIDSSQAPATVFTLDPTNWASNTWTDSTNDYDATTVNVTTNAEASGSLSFAIDNSSYATIPTLQASVYGALTLSAWIKPTEVLGFGSQTIIAKELCYKLRINNDGTVTFSSGKGVSPWEVTATVSAGVVLKANWHHIAVTSDANNTRIYVNGVKQAETTGNLIGYNNAVFDIGAYSSDGNATQSDRFTGLIGVVKMYNYALTEADVIIDLYNANTSRYSLTPIPTSLSFDGNNDYMLIADDQSEWNLGDTYTIEYWSNSNSYASGDPRGVMSQGGGGSKIDVGYSSTGWLFNASQPTFGDEPPPNTWNHVAYVSDGVDTRVYLNGAYVGNILLASLTDGSSDLNVGNRSAGVGQYFNGYLTNLRISSAVEYSGEFLPSTTPTIDSDIRLLLSGRYPGGPTADLSLTPHTAITNYGASNSANFPQVQSMSFVAANQSFIYANAHGDWNLGTTWTIEFWIKPTASSTTAVGGIWGLLNQYGWNAVNSINIALTDGKLAFLSGSNANDDVRFTEPTVGIWTHVAIVNNAGTQTVYYNGIEQTEVSGTYGSANYANSSDKLFIGRLSNEINPAYGGFFNGKLFNIRISNNARYTADFTSTTTYYLDANTQLFLGNYNTFYDMTATRHPITTSSTLSSTDVVKSLSINNPFNGGQAGYVFCLHTDPKYTLFSQIPVGAALRSNLFTGIRTVTRSQYQPAGWEVQYDPTGLGSTSTSDAYTIVW